MSKPLPNEVYNEVQDFMKRGTELWTRLLIYEELGCTLAESEAKRVRYLMEDITRKMEELAA